MTTTLAASSANVHVVNDERGLSQGEYYMMSDRSIGPHASSTRSLSGNSALKNSFDPTMAWSLPQCDEQQSLYTEQSMKRMLHFAEKVSKQNEQKKLQEKRFTINYNDPEYGSHVMKELGWYSGIMPLLEPNGKFMQIWDMLLALCLVFTAVYTPYEIGFLSSDSTAYPRPSFWINRGVDLIFIIDIFLQFFLPYLDIKNGIYVRNRKLIAKKYLSGWFWVDIVSILPFDAVKNINGASFFGKIQAIRLLKLLKLSRLLRVLRSNRVISRLETAIAFNYAIWTMFKFVFGSMLVCHWMASCWGLIEQVAAKKTWTWVDAYEMTRIDIRTGKSNFQPNVVAHRYVAALYFSVYTLTSLGYGDLSPANFQESILSICLIITASFYWAYTIGNFCAVVSTMDVYGVRWRQSMDEINSMMQDRGYPHYLRRRVRLFMRNSRHLQRISHYPQLERHMTLKLRGDMALANHAHWIKNVWYLSGVSRAFVAEISQHMHTLACAPLEHIDIPNALFALQRGIAARSGRPMRKGHVWGLDFVLSGHDNIYVDRIAACALTFCEASWLPQTSLYKLLDEDGFEMEELRIHKACSFYKFKALLIILGQRYKAAAKRLSHEISKQNYSTDDLISDIETHEASTSTRKNKLLSFAAKVSTRHIMQPLPRPDRRARFGAAAGARQQQRDATVNRLYFHSDAKTRSPGRQHQYTSSNDESNHNFTILLEHIQRLEQKIIDLSVQTRSPASSSISSRWDGPPFAESNTPRIPRDIREEEEESKESDHEYQTSGTVTLIPIQSPKNSNKSAKTPVAREIVNSDDEDDHTAWTGANEFFESLGNCAAPT